MTCEECRERLLTGAPTEISAHLESCDSCRELAEALTVGWSDLDRGLDLWGRGGDFDGALIRALKAQPVNNSIWYSDRRFHSLLIAVVALFAIALAFQTRLQPAPAVLPADPIDVTEAVEVIEETREIPWNALSEQDWGLKAEELRQHALVLEDAGALDDLDDEELIGVMFDLYAQIGRAAENRNNASPPFYDMVDERVVNYYWYLAAALATDDPTLLEGQPQDVAASIGNYVDMGARMPPYE